MKLIKILTAISICLSLVIAFLAFREYKRADYFKTLPMRNARHKKASEAQPGVDQEEKDDQQKTDPDEKIS